jgi:hypothetical protein
VPREQGQDQEQYRTEVGEDEAEAAVSVEGFLVVELWPRLDPEDALSRQEDLHDHSNQIQGYVVAQHCRSTPTKTRHRDLLDSSVCKTLQRVWCVNAISLQTERFRQSILVS